MGIKESDLEVIERVVDSFDHETLIKASSVIITQLAKRIIKDNASELEMISDFTFEGERYRVESVTKIIKMKKLLC